jgi:uncharacterized protein
MVVAEWQRAWRALRAAEVLVREGFYEDAVSRAYYATLHAAKAALFIHDVATESHAAVRRMFGLHLIRSGEIESMWSSNLGESLDDRLAADYDASASFSFAEASQECQRTRAFLDRIHHTGAPLLVMAPLHAGDEVSPTSVTSGGAGGGTRVQRGFVFPLRHHHEAPAPSQRHMAARHTGTAWWQLPREAGRCERPPVPGMAHRRPLALPRC